MTNHDNQSLPHQICRKQGKYDGMHLSTDSSSSSSQHIVDMNDKNSQHQYQLNKLLGAGSYGHVIQGYVPPTKHCKNAHDKVAIKVDPEVVFNVWECYIHELVSIIIYIHSIYYCIPAVYDYLNLTICYSVIFNMI